MDTEGARALARRIEEQKAREALLAPSEPEEPAEEVGALPPPANAPKQARNPARDIRMYSQDVQEVTIDGQPAVVTTVRCQALMDGEWRSRIVDVRVDRPSHSG